jgi:hypothetical protein
MLEAAEALLLLYKAADSDNTESNLLKAAKYSRQITGPERKRNVSSKRNHLSLFLNFVFSCKKSFKKTKALSHLSGLHLNMFLRWCTLKSNP